MKKIFCLLISLLLTGSVILAEEEVKPWYDYGLASKLPSLSDVIGKEVEPGLDTVNTSEDFYTEVAGITQEEFQKYTDYLALTGFTVEAFKLPTSFDAMNSEGIYVAVIWQDDGHMTVDAMYE